MAASRKFICVRLATYESKDEGAFLETVFSGRSGVLENTTFVLLGPDGARRLSNAGRGPQWITGGARGPDAKAPPNAAKNLAAAFDKASTAYAGSKAPRELPVSLDFRRALNVASCDGQPLVVAKGSAAKVKELEKRLAKLAWSEDFIGRFHYALVTDKNDLKDIKGVPQGDGVFVIEPGTYGLTGKVIAKVAASANDKKLQALLLEGDEAFKAPSKDRYAHVRSGHRAGAEWESEIPVTDPGPLRGRGRK